MAFSKWAALTQWEISRVKREFWILLNSKCQ